MSKAKWYALVKVFSGSGFGGVKSGSPNKSNIVPSGVMKLATSQMRQVPAALGYFVACKFMEASQPTLAYSL
jgi:hypothetical protein